jgi:hypothetical protein
LRRSDEAEAWPPFLIWDRDGRAEPLRTARRQSRGEFWGAVGEPEALRWASGGAAVGFMSCSGIHDLAIEIHESATGIHERAIGIHKFAVGLLSVLMGFLSLLMGRPDRMTVFGRDRRVLQTKNVIW